MGAFDDLVPGQKAGAFDDLVPRSPRKMGADAQGDFLREELANADWGTRQIAGFGTALSNVWEGAKQKIGLGDEQAIEANKIMADEAPVGSVIGEAALLAGPFGLVGNSIKGAAAVGAGSGFLRPVSGPQTFGNIARGTAENTALSGALSAGGQAVSNAVGKLISKTMQEMALRKAQNAPRDALVNDALDLGLEIPPSSVNPSTWNTIKESIAGKIATAQTASANNSGKFTDLARKEMGLEADAPLTADVLRGRRKLAYEVGYKPVENAGRIETDAAYNKALDEIVAGYVGPSKDFPGVLDDSVTKFVEGAKKVKVPARKEYVDEAGNVVKNFVEPKPPKLRNLLSELKAAGGIHPNELGEIGVDGLQKNFPGIVSRRGKSADSLTEWAKSNGWISEKMAADADMLPGGEHELIKDMISLAAARESVVHPSQIARWQSYQQASKDAVNAGVRQKVTPATEIGGLRVKDFDAKSALQISRGLRKEAGEAFRQGNSALGFAKKEAAQAVEDQVERGIAALGDGAEAKQALELFREARKYIAKSHTIEGGILPGGSAFDPRKVPSRDFGKLEGDLKTAVAFAKNFPKASQSDAQVAGPAVNQLGALLKAGLSGFGGAGGMALGGPAGAAALAAAPFVIPPAMRSYLLSHASQNALRDLYQLGLPARMAGRLGQYAPIGLTVGGADAFGQ